MSLLVVAHVFPASLAVDMLMPSVLNSCESPRALPWVTYSETV